MPKGKKKEIKIAKKITPEKAAPKKEEPKIIVAPVHTSKELKEIAEKRDALIAEIRPKLLTKSQLRRGGSVIRSRYQAEAGYANVLAEINELGAKLRIRPIGLGHLRK